MPTKTHVIYYRYRYRKNDIFDGTVYAQSRNNTFSGTRVPGWRNKIRDGQNAGSAYSVDAVRLDRLENQTKHEHLIGIRQQVGGPIVGYQTDILDGVGGSLDLATTITEVGTASSQAEAQALERIYEKLRSEHESASGMTFLGELKETIRMIRRPGDALLKLLKHKCDTINQVSARVKRLRKRRGESPEAFRRRKAKALYYGTWYHRGAPYSDALSGSVLEWNFGVAPLFSEIRDIARSVAESLHGYEPSRARISGTSDDYVSVYQNSDVPEGYKTISYRDQVSRKTTRSVKYVVGLGPSISAPVGSWALLAERSGFGLNNFVPTLYELMPWSFLLDYVTNVGTVLNAACTSTARVIWVSRTERTVTIGKQVKHSVRASLSNPTLQTTVKFTSDSPTAGRLETTRTRLVRTVMSTLPLPPLVSSLPGIGGNQWINMAALILQTREATQKLLSRG